MATPLPIEVLFQKQTKEQIQARCLAICAALGLKTTSWQVGGVVLTLLGVFAEIASIWSGGIALMARAGFLDFAEGKYLTLVAFYVFGVTRVPFTFAKGDVTLVNASGGLYTYAAGTFVLGRPAPASPDVTYVNADPFTLQPVGNPGATQTIAFRCQVPGARGTASAGSITRLVSTTPGVSATNPAAFVGTNEEGDVHLRARCRAKLGTISPNGPRGSYQYVAETAVDENGDSLGVTRVQIVPVVGSGHVDVYIASPSGAVPPDTVTFIDDLVQRTVVPDAVTCTVHNSTNVVRSVQATIYIYTAANMSTAAVRAAAANLLDDFFKLLPVGGLTFVAGGPGYLPFRALEAKLAQISPYVVEARVVPELDVALAVGNVAVPGTYDFTVIPVPGP